MAAQICTSKRQIIISAGKANKMNNSFACLVTAFVPSRGELKKNICKKISVSSSPSSVWVWPWPKARRPTPTWTWREESLPNDVAKFSVNFANVTVHGFCSVWKLFGFLNLLFSFAFSLLVGSPTRVQYSSRWEGRREIEHSSVVSRGDFTNFGWSYFFR